MPEQRSVTAEDLLMIRYFWEEKGDLTSYCSWEEIQVDLAKRYPAIYDAWARYRSAVKTLDVLVGALGDELEEDQ